MSSNNLDNFDNDFERNTASVLAAQPPPAHHTHHSSDAIRPAADYSAQITNDSEVWKGNNKRHSVLHAGDSARPSDDNQNAFTEDRPMNVQPTGARGVAGKAKATDKIIGKTQKMHEKGELREAGGKEAAAGRARAPHD
ncbi:hypothetical protein BC629DRAFT_1565167 [Irpex lacteus]|nr:hypothetical protein BC629DRAFT_1565167 [Irpex lacteus]